MTDLRKDAGRGLRAANLLSDEILVEAFEALRTSYLVAWETTAARDTDARERLWQAVQIVGKVRAHLKAIVDNGKIAEKELQDIERLGERKKLFGVV